MPMGCPSAVGGMVLALGMMGVLAAAVDARPIGVLETASRRLIAGWAHDPEHPDLPVWVRIQLVHEGQVVMSHETAATEVRPELAALLGGGAQSDDEGPARVSEGHAVGFAWTGWVAPLADPLMVELAMLDRDREAWVTTAVARLPPRHAAFLAADLLDLSVGIDPDDRVATVRAVILPQREMHRRGDGGAPRYLIEVWGVRGRFETHLGPESSPVSLRARVDLATHPEVRHLYEATGTLLVAVWADDPAHPQWSALIGSAEVVPEVDGDEW